MGGARANAVAPDDVHNPKMWRLCFRSVDGTRWPATDQCINQVDKDSPQKETSFMDLAAEHGTVLYEADIAVPQYMQFTEGCMHRLAAENPVATTEARCPGWREGAQRGFREDRAALAGGRLCPRACPGPARLCAAPCVGGLRR